MDLKNVCAVFQCIAPSLFALYCSLKSLSWHFVRVCVYLCVKLCPCQHSGRRGLKTPHASGFQCGPRPSHSTQLGLAPQKGG